MLALTDLHKQLKYLSTEHEPMTSNWL